MAKYKILDTEETRDIFEGLIGEIFEAIEIDNNGHITLNTYDGVLIFHSDEVEIVEG